jgi:hypothetical protein
MVIVIRLIKNICIDTMYGLMYNAVRKPLLGFNFFNDGYKYC